ncbi:formylglycine-generating enzyme family protein [Candidatus Latescibacterota bacterium]
MSGNVFEWCSDRYGSYPSESVNNPTGALSGSSRVKRGGGFSSYYGSCTTADRAGRDPGHSDHGLGFRVVSRQGGM